MLINELWKIPFLRFILPFIAGILSGSSFLVNPVVLLSLALLFIGLSFVYRPFLNHEQSYHKRWVFGALITVSLFFVAAYLTNSYSSHSEDIMEAEKVIAIINEPPKETEKSIKLEVKVSEYQTNDIWRKDNSKLLIYLEKDSLAKTLIYGDQLLLKGNLRVVQNAGNPHEFDYKKYLSRKQIYFQSYQNSSQWKKLSSGNGNQLYIFAYSTRAKVLNIYRSSGINGDEFAILAALTLGVKDYLSDEIVEAYSDSGAMHVLAVSGLHVGIITMVLNILLFPLRKNKKLRIIHSFVIIISIWFFALITGLAPSVTRASIMFTFFILGQNSAKKPSSYNSLAASAFIILLIDPNSLFHVGFQLSFLAVMSILFFQPRIYRLFDIQNIWVDKIWQLTTVSIAAQIGTVPISIYYFHQFPLYALATNLIAIPAAFIIMSGTVLLLISNVYAPLAKLVAILLSFIIKIFNKSTSFIEDLPFASIEYISLNKTELLFLYTALSLLILFAINKKKNLAFIILVLFIITFGIRNYRYFEKTNLKEFIVFNTNGKSSLVTTSNQKMMFYADYELVENKKSMNYLTANMITEEFVSELDVKTIKKTNSNKADNQLPINFLQIDSLKIAYISGKTDRFQSEEKLTVNYLIFSKNASLNIENLKSLFSFEKLIIDSSVPKWKQEVLKKDCKREGVSFHNVSEQGAFIWSNNTR